MVLNIAGIFGKTPRKGRPMLNQLPVNISGTGAYYTSTVLSRKKLFWDWFKSRPELNSPVMIRVDDTIGEVNFVSPEGTYLSKRKLKEAEKFWRDNQLYERLKSFQYDRLATGSGFLWIGCADLKSLKELAESFAMKYSRDEVLFREVATRLFLKAIDEDLRKPRKVDYIASSTVAIEHDSYDIKSYIQNYNARQEVFGPEEIIHVPLMRLDGKVDGFSPVESLPHEMILLWAIKENMLAYFRNGGVPKKIFTLPEEISQSENHQWLVQELMDKGALENRHGNLVLTGKVEVKDLEDGIKDMEYKELALWITSNIAYALRIPNSRMPYMIGSAQNKGDAGGLAESGYWSMIESDQKTIEMHLNSQLFERLGFCVKFRKRYKIDDLRETQTMQQRIDAVTKIQSELLKIGKKLNPEKLYRLMDLSKEDVVEASEDEVLMGQAKTGLLNRSFAKDRDVTAEPNERARDSLRRDEKMEKPEGVS